MLLNVKKLSNGTISDYLFYLTDGVVMYHGRTNFLDHHKGVAVTKNHFGRRVGDASRINCYAALRTNTLTGSSVDYVEAMTICIAKYRDSSGSVAQKAFSSIFAGLDEFAIAGINENDALTTLDNFKGFLRDREATDYVFTHLHLTLNKDRLFGIEKVHTLDPKRTAELVIKHQFKKAGMRYV